MLGTYSCITAHITVPIGCSYYCLSTTEAIINSRRETMASAQRCGITYSGRCCAKQPAKGVERALPARTWICRPLVAPEIARGRGLLRRLKFAFEPTDNLTGLERIRPLALLASQRARPLAAESQSEAHQRTALRAPNG